MIEKRGPGALDVAAAYIGTLIGAGFASGQEILQFFALFGDKGLYGVVLMTALLWAFGYIAMTLAARERRFTYAALLQSCTGKASVIFSAMTSFFLFGGLTVMMAATGALFSTLLGWPHMLGSGLMAAVTIFTVLCGLSAIVGSFRVLVPIMLGLIAIIGIMGIFYPCATPDKGFSPLINPMLGEWWMSSILYVSYNMLVAVVVLIPLSQGKQRKLSRLGGAGLGALGCGVSAAIVCLALHANMPVVFVSELPMMALASNLSPVLIPAYALILVLGTFTTAVGCLFGFIGQRDENKGDCYGKIVIVGIAAFIASLAGFSNLVSLLYPLFGWLGLSILTILLWRWTGISKGLRKRAHVEHGRRVILKEQRQIKEKPCLRR